MIRDVALDGGPNTSLLTQSAHKVSPLQNVADIKAGHISHCFGSYAGRADSAWL